MTAPTFASIATINSATDTTAYAHAGGVTPTASRLLVALIDAQRTTSNVEQPTVTGFGLTWSHIDHIAYVTGGATNRDVFVFAALTGGSPSSSAFTVTFANTHIGCEADVIECIDAYVSGTAADAIAQTPKNSGAGASELTVTFASAAHADNRQLLAITGATDTAITPDWTELNELRGPNPNRTLETQKLEGSYDTTGRGDWATNNTHGGIGVEVRGAGTVGGPSPQTVEPGAIALTLTPVAPIAAQSNLSPDALALTATAVAPSLLQAQLVSPPAIGLTLTPVAPLVAQTSVTVGVVSLTLTPVAPAVTNPFPQDVSPGALALTLTPLTPYDIEGGSITFTNLGASAAPDFTDETDTSTYTIPSWTPPSGGGGLIVAYVYSRNVAGTNPTTPTVEGNNVDYTETASVAGGQQRLTLFAANSAGSTTGTTVVDFGGEAQTSCIVSFSYAHQVEDVAIVQSPTNSGASGTTATVSLATEAAADNRMIAGIGHQNVNAVTPRTNWTELDEFPRLETQYRGDAAETTASGTWTSSAAWLAIAAELDHRGVTTQNVLPGAIALTLTPVAPVVSTASGAVSPAAIGLTITPVAPYDIEGGAITFSNLGASGAPDFIDETNQSTYTTASWTPPNGGGGLIIAFVWSRNVAATTPVTPTVSGNGGEGFEWGEVVSRAGTQQRLTMFFAPSEDSTAGVTTIDFGGEDQTACAVSFSYVHQIEGFIQFPTAAGGSGTASLVSLSAASNSNNRMMAATGRNMATAVTPRTNWVELDDLVTGTTRGLHTQYRPDATETTASATWSNSGAWTIIAVEFDHRGVGDIMPDVIALTVSPATPVISFITAKPPAVSLTLTPVAPTFIGTLVSPGAIALTVTPVVPSVTATAQFLASTPIALTLTPVVPTSAALAVAPAATALTLTPVTPAVKLLVAAPATSLTLTPVAPLVVESPLARPPVLGLALTPVSGTVIGAVGELADVTDSVRIGATWFDPVDIAGTKQAGRVHDVTYAGGYYYIATEGADRAMTLAGVTHTVDSLIRINATTMDLDTSWFPTFDLASTAMQLLSIATDGTTIWVGGNFSSMTLGGITYNRSRIIAINAITGVPTSWSAPSPINDVVRGVAYDSGQLYVAGSFTGVGGSSRNRLAALSASTGALQSWNPNSGQRINDIKLFTESGGAKRLVCAMNGNGALGGSGSHNVVVTGAIGETDAGALVWGASEGSGGGHVVAVSNTKQRIFYGTKGSGGNVVWCYNASGTKQWSGNSINTNGDVQALDVYKGSESEDLLYVGTHDTSFSSTPGGSAGANVGSGFARFDIDTGNFDPSFFPEFKDDASAPEPYDGHALKLWCIRGFENRFALAIGGDFTRVDTSSGIVSPAPRRIAFFMEAGGAPPAGEVNPQPIALSVVQPAGGWDEPWDGPWDAGLLISQGLGGSTTSVPAIALTLTPQAPAITALYVTPAVITITVTPVAPLIFGPVQTVTVDLIPLVVVGTAPSNIVEVGPGPEPPEEELVPIFGGTPIVRKRRVLFTRPR